MSDYRDLVITTLLDSEAMLQERISSLEADVDVYRVLAQQGIHSLHRLTQRHDRLRATYYRTLDELRALRTGTRRAA